MVEDLGAYAWYEWCGKLMVIRTNLGLGHVLPRLFACKAHGARVSAVVGRAERCSWRISIGDLDFGAEDGWEPA